MSIMLDKLFLYFQYPFVVNALIVGVLIALCSSMLGVTLVLKRYSFIGDGLSHVAFGAMAVAAVAGFTDDMPFILLVTVAFAILLLRTGQNAKIKGDAAIAMISVGALAVGYLLMNVFSSSANVSGDVCTTLFGSTSILTLTKMQVGMCGVLSAVVIGVFVLFYNKIFSLLISALVIFPALSAMRIFNSFKSVILCSAVFSVICAFVGIVLSILAGTPVGATVVMIDMLAFGAFYVIGSLKNGGH